MKNDNLAIIIPAYKAEYLEQTLKSIAGQSDKHFKVYIGDDCSPYRLKNIIEKFSASINLEYVRFDTNMGKDNLVEQWNRCLSLMHDEEFFCMFSDDDLMEPDCVRRFYETVESYPEYDVYHFDIDIINNDNTVQKHCTPYDSEMSSGKFYEDLFNERIDARMPEFIFRTRHFLKSGGFVNFIQAYRSDNATVISCAYEKGIRTVPGPYSKILWRDSGMNISSSRTTEDLFKQSKANIQFFNWAHAYFHGHGGKYPVTPETEKKHIMRFVKSLLGHIAIRRLMSDILKYRPHDFRYSVRILHGFLKLLLRGRHTS